MSLPGAGELNDLPTNQAMGLPLGHVGSAWQDLIARCTLAVEENIIRLMALAESESEAFPDRYGAGVLLGLYGDPRIRPFNPQMILVPGGTYTIGTSESDVDRLADELHPLGVKRSWIEKETPRHNVEVNSFNIGLYPVTNLEYKLFLQEHAGAEIPSSWNFGVMPLAQANHPVHSISPDTADQYVRWLSDRTGCRYRLPTEAEWEIAASGGHREYPWGEKMIPGCANTVETGILWTTPVGIFPRGRSAFGCLDMAGNVEEFVQDTFKNYPDGKSMPDDLATLNPHYRVARGGSFARYYDLARCSRRHGHIRSPIYAMGFRLACDTIDGDSAS